MNGSSVLQFLNNQFQAMLKCSLPLEWLSRRASTPEILLRRYGDGGKLGKLIAAMQPGDEIRKFNSPGQTWQRRMGRFGFALVRDGKTIDGVILRMN